MTDKKTNKRKIINDPVYGFINIHSDLIFDIIEHPYFQRLRRIKQLGLTNYVYPGANHSRFQHALGAMHLMDMAINIIRSKGHEVTDEEKEAAQLAILLHDIGHGPFSHTLENILVEDIHHEKLSLWIMNRLNDEFNGQLNVAIEIFKNQYHKKFLHQLVSSQLDMDRLDYLRRDSFFTGVSEGVIGSDRIIKMLNVVDDQLVVEAKGIYSIEKFLMARRVMYWQVYLHKAVISAEYLINQVLKRAKKLALEGKELFATPPMKFFLYHKGVVKKDDPAEFKTVLDNFLMLDDNDIVSAIKNWIYDDDIALSTLSGNLIHRKLFKIEIRKKPFSKDELRDKKNYIGSKLNLPKDLLSYFVFTNEISNNTYSWSDDKIQILYKNNQLIDIVEASDILDSNLISNNVKKYFLCYPKV